MSYPYFLIELVGSMVTCMMERSFSVVCIVLVHLDSTMSLNLSLTNGTTVHTPSSASDEKESTMSSSSPTGDTDWKREAQRSRYDPTFALSSRDG